MNLSISHITRSQQWSAMPGAIQEYASGALDLPLKLSQLGDSAADFYQLRNPPSIDSNNVGHVYIQGMLMNSCPPIYEQTGMVTRYSTIKSETETLLQRGVGSIVYHINSPGGTVSGCIECATFIQNLNVPTSTICDELACSAAYKLASATDTITASPSATVGNIGSIMCWEDCSEFWKSLGIEFKSLTSEGAVLKSTFHQEPNEEQISFLQESINQSGQVFRDFVKNARPNIDEEVFKAGWYSGDEALRLGLIDNLDVANSEKTIRKKTNMSIFGNKELEELKKAHEVIVGEHAELTKRLEDQSIFINGLTDKLVTSETNAKALTAELTAANTKLLSFADEVETAAMAKFESLGGQPVAETLIEPESGKTLEEFNKLTPSAKMAYCKAGGKIN